MDNLIGRLAILAFVDSRLDDLNEEFGDLPEILKEKKEKANGLKSLADETEKILEDIRKFVATSKVTLIELKNKEEKLAKQQFKVRNNKEFDAITKEISNIRDEHTRLTDQLRTEGVKEENLMGILEQQKKEYDEALANVENIEKDLDVVSSDQNEEVSELNKKREKISKKIEKKVLKDYKRIREYHRDAVVRVNRNSCSGCFSAVPPQKIVEIRNNPEKIYTCESCGRMLYPEEYGIDDSTIDKI